MNSVRSAVASAAAALMLSVFASPAVAAQVVVDFESLSGSGVLVDGYGGITWNGGFSYYEGHVPGFPPHSGDVSAYFNYEVIPPALFGDVGFNFDAPVIFQGAWFSGQPTTVDLLYYLDGVQVGANRLAVSSTPTFLPGVAAAVDEVRIRAYAGFWVMDDITYETDLGSPAGAIPEPATWAVMILGFGVAGGFLRRAARLVPA